MHHANMAKEPGHFLRSWRERSELTLEEVAERVKIVSADRALNDPDVRPMSMTHATLSRIERGKLPYNQHLLEVLATIYRTDVPSLIMRDPGAADGIWTIWDQLKPVERKRLVQIGQALKDTGTDG